MHTDTGVERKEPRLDALDSQSQLTRICSAMSDQTHSRGKAHMCESNAYLIKDGKEQLVLESVNLIRPMENSVILRSLFGEEVTVQARLRELDLTGHRIVLEAT
jgi:predicted RNA-binding protein